MSILKWVKKDISKYFVLVLVKNGVKNIRIVRARDIYNAFAVLTNKTYSFDGELVEAYSFNESPVNEQVKALTGFNMGGIVGDKVLDWVSEEVKIVELG